MAAILSDNVIKKLLFDYGKPLYIRRMVFQRKEDDALRATRHHDGPEDLENHWSKMFDKWVWKN